MVSSKKSKQASFPYCNLKQQQQIRPNLRPGLVEEFFNTIVFFWQIH